MTIEEMVRKLGTDVAALKDLQARSMKGEALSEDEQRLLDAAKNTREGNKFVSPHASLEHNNRVAQEKGADLSGGGKPIQKGERPSGAGLIRAIVAARKGDLRAYERLTSGVDGKAWTEGTDTAGGFLVTPEQLPDYIRKRKASSPIRELCAQHTTTADQAWIVVEDGTVTVAHTPESATKPSSTGSIARKIATTFKVAGVTAVSDELLDDANGAPERLISEQFGAQVGITIDTALISGTGVGQPVGVRNASGVASTAVDGQTGQALFNSVLKALGHLRGRFYNPEEVTVVVHPRDLTRVELATSGGGEYLFPGGLAEHLPCNVVSDANVPVNLGAGANESLVIVGAFGAGAAFFSRQPLTVEASSDAGFTTDETLIRGVERYGFGVTQPGAFELITGVLPS